MTAEDYVFGTTTPKVGRPTKYNTAYIDEVDYYLQECGSTQQRLPKKEEFALRIGINDDTLVEWCKTYPDFSAAIKKIEISQRNQLIDDGMYGGKEVNAAMAIFLLKANHHMIETQRTELTGKDGEALVVIKDGGSSK